MWTIRYEGKMTDKIPAWAFTVSTDKALTPIQYNKAAEYFKKNFHRKKIKIISASILGIYDYNFDFNDFRRVTSCMSIISTWFTVAEKQFHALQSIIFYISDICSSVTKHDYVLADSEGNIIAEYF
jgi:hypothetical protein